jgi:hypothetical protein
MMNLHQEQPVSGHFIPSAQLEYIKQKMLEFRAPFHYIAPWNNRKVSGYFYPSLPEITAYNQEDP